MRVEEITDERVFIYLMRRQCRTAVEKVWELILLYWRGWDIYEKWRDSEKCVYIWW